MINYLKPLNLLIGLTLYIPFWWRIVERGTSGDISLVFQAMLLVMQLINLRIAWVENSRFFIVWYVLQATLVTASIGLVVWFYD